MARSGQTLQIVQFVSLIDALEFPIAPVLKKLGPDVIRLALHYGICVLQRFIRLERGMESPHHNRYSTLAELIAKLIGAEGRAYRRRHPHQIPAGIEIHIFQALVTER